LHRAKKAATKNYLYFNVHGIPWISQGHGGNKEVLVIIRVSHLTLYVRDQKVAHEVYVNKLGFKVNTDQTMENGLRWLTVSPPGQPELQIILAEPRAPMVKPELLPHIMALLAADGMGAGVWECDDCERTYRALKDKGIDFTKPPTREFYGVEAIFKDGCGNWFSMTEHPKTSRS
jgi:catechol 2,3-dioxygenase-like lactoylglutathione lyase family enzyme